MATPPDAPAPACAEGAVLLGGGDANEALK